jgi:hypothetical protein
MWIKDILYNTQFPKYNFIKKREERKERIKER